MDPDMVTRLKRIAEGVLVQHDRVTGVTGVTDPPSPAPQEVLPASSGEEQARVTPVTPVTPVTRIYAITGNDVSNATGCTERVTAPAEPGRLDIAGGVGERAAMAQHEAGFPAEFALAFAHLQVNTPADVDEEVWHRAVDVMGRVLDQCQEDAHQHSQTGRRFPPVPNSRE